VSPKRDFIKEMKGVLFESYSEREDGMVEAVVSKVVYNMIISKVPQNKALSSIDFQSVLLDVCEEVVKFMQSKIEDLSDSIATPFAFDFVSQLLMSASTIIPDKGDEYDPMFG
tara:strand:- start:1295 stop:1633 length:339 start_codon:yes stop_codon:yes gene_type:complete